MVGVRTIFQLAANGTFFENIAVRPCGTVLSTRVDVPEVYQINPVTGAGAPLINIPGMDGASGIAEVEPDVWAIGAGLLDDGPVQVPGSYGIWIADLRRVNCQGTTTNTVDATLLATVTTADNINGVTLLNKKTLLLSDSHAGKVYSMDLKTGRYKVVLEGEQFEPSPNSPVPVGVNGLKVLKKRRGQTYLYFANSFKAFQRIPIDPNSGRGVGEAEVVAAGFPQDDFALAEDGTAYVTTQVTNELVRVDPDGEWEVVAGSPDSFELIGATSAAFGRTKKDKNVIYVSGSGGLFAPINGVIEPAKIIAVDLGA